MQRAGGCMGQRPVRRDTQCQLLRTLQVWSSLVCPEPALGRWTVQAEIHAPGTSLAVASEVRAQCGAYRPGPSPAIEGGCSSYHTCPGDAAFSSERNSLCFRVAPRSSLLSANYIPNELSPRAGVGREMGLCCCCLVAKLCRTVCDTMDCSPPGSSVHGILQARILE